MRLSASNMAWDLPEEAAAASLLADRGIDRVDLVPGRYFPDPATAKDAEVARVRAWWEERGFGVEGMQSLLFGSTGLNLFGDASPAMFDRLAAVCRIGGGLGARALTFGSPRQRDRTGLDDAAVLSIAVDFFGHLGDHAASAGVILCLEPNAAVYGCNFMTGTLETAGVVKAVAHPAVRLQLDVGNLALNGEDAAATIAEVAPVIGHVHASEPQLLPLGDAGAPHREAGEALRLLGGTHTVTIEMARTTTEPALDALARAIDVARAAYGDAA